MLLLLTSNVNMKFELFWLHGGGILKNQFFSKRDKPLSFEPQLFLPSLKIGVWLDNFLLFF